MERILVHILKRLAMCLPQSGNKRKLQGFRALQGRQRTDLKEFTVQKF